jgi:hypothetical protein
METALFLTCQKTFFLLLYFFLFFFLYLFVKFSRYKQTKQMIPDTKIIRGLIYTSAVLQTAVAPFAFFYYIYYITSEQKLFSIHSSVDTFIHYWLGCELMFYVYFQITRSRMQRILPSVAPSAKERSDLYSVCLANIDQAETWLPDWFMLAHDASLHPQFEDIGRDNVAEW